MLPRGVSVNRCVLRRVREPLRFQVRLVHKALHFEACPWTVACPGSVSAKGCVSMRRVREPLRVQVWY